MLSVTQTEESHVKSLWCRHWSKTRNRSRLLFVPQVQPDATFPLCCELVLFHICCDLRLRVVQLCLSSAASPERRGPGTSSNNQKEGITKNSIWAFLGQRTLGSDLFLWCRIDPQQTHHSTRRPSEKAKNKWRDQLRGARRHGGWLSVARGHFSREDAFCQRGSKTRPLTHHVTLQPK